MCHFFTVHRSELVPQPQPTAREAGNVGNTCLLSKVIISTQQSNHSQGTGIIREHFIKK
jgi:hypothetical protein